MTSLQMIISKLEDQDLPIIGKFEESINLTKATQPVKMYWYDEEILEEPFDLDVKDFKDFAKKKRMRRRAMRYNKSKLILEDSSTNIRDNNHLKYEGRVTNMGTSETTKSDARFKYGASSSLEADFKYVTLQPQKVVVDGKEITQIVVCPVGDFYLFRKVATGEQQFLSAVDDAFDAKIKHDHAKLDRYKAISKALSRDSERSKSGDVKDNDESNRLDIPFGRHAAMGGRVNARSKLKKYVEGDTDVGVSGMDSEAVADFDGEAEFDAICGGDYEKVYADDEEEHVLAEQAQMEQREDTLAGQEVLGDDEGMTQDEHGNVIDDDIEDDNDVYIDVEYEDDDEPKSSDLRLSLSKPGMVNFDMERDAREVGRMVKKDTAKENESKARNKRVREDESQPTPVQKTETSLTESSSSTAKTLEPLSLSEESVRAYFESLGGRVTIRAMKEAFKTTIFEHKKIHGDNSGRDMLLDIVKRLTKTVSDPVLGDVLVLKSSVSMTTHS